MNPFDCTGKTHFEPVPLIRLLAYSVLCRGGGGWRGSRGPISHVVLRAEGRSRQGHPQAGAHADGRCSIQDPPAPQPQAAALPAPRRQGARLQRPLLHAQLRRYASINPSCTCSSFRSDGLSCPATLSHASRSDMFLNPKQCLIMSNRYVLSLTLHRYLICRILVLDVRGEATNETIT
jgi:hypothetical protein